MVVVLEMQRSFLRYAAVGLSVNAILNVLLIPRYGFIAAAWITLLTEAVVMFLMTRSILTRLEMRPRLDRMARTLLAATVMSLITWIARDQGAPLGGLVAIAGISYLLAVTLLRVLSISEVKAVLRKEPLVTDGRAGDTPASQTPR
jgi:O-antigen/teichoic acid export membrane protein